MIETGWVYVITNESMPGLVKVGVTKNRPEQRALELDETGSPTPYKVETAFLFSEAAERVEKKAHALLADVRVRGNREWFKCLPRLAGDKVLDAADILNSVVLKNEPVHLSQQDWLLREEKKKREREEEEARQLLKWEEEKASEARKREEEKVNEARRREEEKARKELEPLNENIREERNKILAPYKKKLASYEKKLKRLMWWEKFWLWVWLGPIALAIFSAGFTDIFSFFALVFIWLIPIAIPALIILKFFQARLRKKEPNKPKQENIPEYITLSDFMAENSGSVIHCPKCILPSLKTWKGEIRCWECGWPEKNND